MSKMVKIEKPVIQMVPFHLTGQNISPDVSPISIDVTANIPSTLKAIGKALNVYWEPNVSKYLDAEQERISVIYDKNEKPIRIEIQTRKPHAYIENGKWVNSIQFPVWKTKSIITEDPDDINTYLVIRSLIEKSSNNKD